MPKNVQTTTQLHSFHMLTRQCSKAFNLGFNNMWTENFQMFNLDLEKAEDPEIKLPNLLNHRKSKRIPEKASTSASLTTLKLLTVWITTNCGEFLKRWEYWPLYLPPEKPVCRSRRNTVLDREQQTDSKLGKEYVKAVYCHLAYLTSMQSTSWHLVPSLHDK